MANDQLTLTHHHMDQEFRTLIVVKYTTIYFILCLFNLGCAVTKPIEKKKHLKVRLSRVWQSPRHLCITAINKRGPLNVWLAKDQDFKVLDLEKNAWIKPDLVHSLQLNTTVNLKGQIQTRLSSVLLDGLEQELQLKFNILSGSQVKHLPRMVDAMIPVEYVFDLKDEVELAVTRQGHLIKKPTTSMPINLDLSPTDFLSRFQEQFNPLNAFPNLLVGTRVDEAKQIHIRWLIPNSIIPKGFWIVTSLNPVSPKQGPIVALRIKKHRRPIPINPISPLNDHLIKQTYLSTVYHSFPECTSRKPCPLFLKDIMRLQQQCHHDLCVISLQK